MLKHVRFWVVFSLVAGVMSGCVNPFTADNEAPVANAGSDATVDLGEIVYLNGNQSSDADEDDITFSWEWASRPDGSTAYLYDATTSTPDFTPDEAGIYQIRLTVSDGELESTATVTITVVITTVTLDESIYSDLHLKNLFTDPSKVDYLVDGTIGVHAALTIDPGVNIEITSSGGIDINDGGTIIAVGKADSLITFTGVSKTPGAWDGIWIASNNPNNQLTYVDISYGGSDDYANVYVVSNGQVKITNSILRESATYGLHVHYSGNLPLFENNTFSDNQIAPVDIPASLMGSLDNGSTYSDGNTHNYISVNGNHIETDATWPSLDVPYRVDGGIDIYAAVTVEPGARLLFTSGASLDVYSTGSLYAVGTLADSIYFAGEVATQGYWTGIWIASNNPNNLFSYTSVAHGGCNDYANIYVTNDGQVSITNSILRSSSTYGLQMNSSTRLSGYAANTFRGNLTAPVYIPAQHIGSLDGASDYEGGNGHDYILVYGSHVETEQIWQAQAVPYHIESGIDIYEHVTIVPGAVFEFGAGAGIDVYMAGSLTSIGRSDAMITFTGAVKTNGYWTGIWIESNNSNNRFMYTDIAYGGGNSYADIYLTSNASVNVESCILRNSATYGVYASSGAQVTLTANVYQNNTLGGTRLPN